jgi:radical SAM-linked protein
VRHVRIEMVVDKVRIRFGKTGATRLLSHLDLVRSFERLLRRADIPFASTNGFHPTPRMIFALSLPLGVIGCEEVLEIELTQSLEPDDILQRLRVQAPPGIDFLSARRITRKETARPRRVAYRFHVGARSGLAERCRWFLEQNEIWSSREKPRPRQVNIRPYIESLTLNENILDSTIWVTQEGTARADELIRLLLEIEDHTSLLIERNLLELSDEIPPAEAERTPTINAQTRPWNRPIAPTPVETPLEVWGATANGPVVE